MNKFKKNVFRTVEEVAVSPSTPSFTVQFQTSTLCYGATSVRINTSVPVKVNMTSSFDSGAFYYTEVGYRDSNIVDEVVSTMAIYRFGIEAANGGTLTQHSEILFTINDFSTGAVLQSYTFERDHAISPC